MLNIISILALCFCAAYALFISACIIGWLQNETAKNLSGETNFISILVPIRNEEKTITHCLESICKQDFPFAQFEIILINDHSTDDSVLEISKFIERNQQLSIQLLNMDSRSKGSKKEAIEFGVRHAIGEIIICTDADCILPNGWLNQYNSEFRNPAVKMIAGPVEFTGNGIFEKIQSLEMAGLCGIAAAFIRLGKPLLCNGANLGFRKQIFKEVGGYESSRPSVSGDDTQMMAKVHAKYPYGIRYLRSRESIVRTNANRNMPEFMQQRKRWASKIPVAVPAFTLGIAIIAWCAHAFLFVSILQSVLFPHLWTTALPALALKIIPEFVFLYLLTGFYRNRSVLWLFFPAQPFYLLYIVLVGIGAPFAGFRWKGRTYKTANTISEK